MSCFHPKKGWKAKYPNKNGRFPIVFSPPNPRDHTGAMSLPCGKCMGCRADQAHAWAIRIYQEASLYDQNSFVTLTYDDEHLPKDGKLDKKHLQDFWKEIRREEKVRYFACGEYGERSRRAHYHAIIFGHDFLANSIKINEKLYSSPWLSSKWNKGNVLISEFTMATACYVAGYVNKKIGDKDTFNTMSLRPGIGSGWLAKYVDDVSRLGSVVIEGKECPVPRRYFLWALDEFEHIKIRRQEDAKKKEQRLFEKHGMAFDKEQQRECAAKEVYLQQRRKHVEDKEKI